MRYIITQSIIIITIIILVLFLLLYTNLHTQYIIIIIGRVVRGFNRAERARRRS